MKSYYQFEIQRPDIFIDGKEIPYYIDFNKIINKIEFIPKKVGNNISGENEINKEVCRSFEAKCDINLILENSIFKKYAEFLEEPETEKYFLRNEYFNLLKYEEGDFFKEHQDSKYIENHIGTILVYPPKKLSNYEGGELYLSKENVIIEAYEDKWSIVLLHVNTLHEVKPLKSGLRYVFKQHFIIDDNIKIILESKLIENINFSIDKIEDNKFELATEITRLNKEITNLKKKKYFLENADKCYEIVNEIINTLKYRGVKIICQNYYENPTLEKITGLDKYVMTLIQKDIKKEIKLRMFNQDGIIRIGKSMSEWYEIPGKIEELYNDEYLDMTEQKFEYLPFEKYKTYRISFDNMLTGNYQGILSEYNDQEYDNYLQMKISVIIIY